MKRPRAATAVVGFALAAVLAGGCEGTGFPTLLVDTDPGVNARVAFIDLSPDSVRLQSVGESVQLVAVPLDANGEAVAGAQIRWTSSNSNVATVTGTGVVIGQSEGRARITAESGAVRASALVTVDLDDEVGGTGG